MALLPLIECNTTLKWSSTGSIVFFAQNSIVKSEYDKTGCNIDDFISDFHSTGNVIASICHAAQLLISANIVNGKNISGYYSIKDDINNAGATYTDEPAVVDSNIVTTAHYKDLGPWMKATLNLVGEIHSL